VDNCDDHDPELARMVSNDLARSCAILAKTSAASERAHVWQRSNSVRVHVQCRRRTIPMLKQRLWPRIRDEA